MATVAYTLFLPEVLPDCPGAPEPVAINAIRNACYEFCRKALVLTEIQASQAYTEGVADYTLAPSTSQLQVVKAMSVTIDGKRTVDPFRTDELVRTLPGWQTETGMIVGYLQPTPQDIIFIRVPDVSGVFVPIVATAPARDSTLVDRRLYDQYLEVIKLGALARLKAIANAPFYDPVGAAACQQQFLMGVNAAVVEKNMENSRALVRVAPRQFL